MANDLLDHLPRLRKPTAAIGWVAGLYLLITLPMAAVNLEENWRHPIQGLTLWLAAWVVLAVPLTVLSAVLAARVEQAATGIRHPQRAGWVGVSLGVMLAAHWAAHLLWSPTLALWALTSSYRREDYLVGAVAGMIAWAFFIAGIWIARYTAGRLRARSWEGLPVLPPSSMPRLPTAWLGAIAYGLALLPGSLAMGALAVGERMPLGAVGLWGTPGVVLVGLGAAWGAWLYDGLEHATGPQQKMPRFVELVGCAWIAHWLPFWFFAALPFWGDDRHEDQLVASVVAALLVVVGVTAWSYGRAARELAVA